MTDPDGPGVLDLWRASDDRPLTRALAALPLSTSDKTGPLLVDAPLSGSLRTLARLPGIAPARTAELVALRLRMAIGALLRQDAPELACAVRSRPSAPLVRAAALTVTSWGGLAPVGQPPSGPVTAVCPRRRIRVPGFPETSLKDEVWQGSWPDAVELGATPDGFWEHIAAHGLLLPSSWLADAGWPALWARAARHG